MLLELNIENFALIDTLQVRFGAGFNVLTGETGAGKSIVIDAINAILGERMGADVIRSGSRKASIEAAFDLSGSSDRLQELQEAGVLDSDETLLAVSRDFAASGKSQCRVGGRLSPVSFLKEVVRNLVDVHGQHEHQSLLHPEQHLEILDHWCGREVLALRLQCAELDARRRSIIRDLSQLQLGEREKAQRLDLLRFQASEIDEAKLVEGEEDELTGERSRLANMEKLMAQVSKARALLTGGEGDRGAALDALEKSSALLDESSRDDPQLQPIAEALQGAVFTLQDTVQELAVYHDNLETNPTRLEEVEDRLALLRKLKRKYGETAVEILTFRAKIEEEISLMEGAGEREAQLQTQLEAVVERLGETAAHLSHRRCAGAQEMEGRVSVELADLALGGAEFSVRIEPQDPGATGADRVEFMFSANPGEPARPLARIASGGEMSRIMLALKSLLASSVGVPTVIFDEVDVGVGGRTGEAIGEKLAAVGTVAQVICVTHLPQVAALADSHYSVLKEVSDGRTTVRVKRLSEEDRVEELSRMLGGGHETAMGHARAMLARRRHPSGNGTFVQRQLLELEA